MKTTLIAILALVAGTLPAAAEEWAKTYTLSGAPDLRIETSDANIHVDTAEQNTIDVKVTSTMLKIGSGRLQIVEHQTGNTVEIEVRYPHHGITFTNGNGRVDVEVRMPHEGRVNLHTGDGRIDISRFKGDIELRSGDGSQTVESVDGRLRATTGDGHIQADGRFDVLELKTGDGHLDVRADSGSTVGEEWRMETGDGSVSLAIPGSLAAHLDLHTGDGHIDLDLPITTDGRVRGNDVRGKLNGGGNLMMIHTGDGSIHVHKS